MDETALAAIGITVVSLAFTVATVLFALVLTVASIALPLWILMKIMKDNADKHAKLMATGLAAPAIVVAAAETGMYVNQRPMVRITLDVRPPGGESFRASVERLISMLDAPKVQPGAQVDVRYAAENPRNMVITSF